MWTLACTGTPPMSGGVWASSRAMVSEGMGAFLVLPDLGSGKT
jgi:hypothetical protein